MASISDALGQELIPYRLHDVYAESFKSKSLNSSIRLGGDVNYQYRNFFTNKNLLYTHLDNNFYIFRGDSTFSGVQIDYEFTYLSNSNSVIPTLTNKLAFAGYLNLTGGYKLGLIRYDFPNQVKYEWTLEVVINAFDLGTGGFIFARNITDQTHYYQLGYRYNISALTGNTYSRNLIEFGWALSRAKFPDLEGNIRDRWSKLKFELSLKRFPKKISPFILNTSISRDYRGKVWYWQLGTLLDIQILNSIWIKDE